MRLGKLHYSVTYNRYTVNTDLTHYEAPTLVLVNLVEQPKQIFLI